MIIYIVIFFISSMLFELSKKVRTKFIQQLLCIFALLIPSILAGVRDYTIGTDINVYGNNWFYYTVNTSDYFQCLRRAFFSDVGLGYVTLNYIVARFTDNAHVFYFVLNLLANIGVYYGLKRNKDIVDIPIGMFVYYCVFYNIFYNALRQSLALVLVFWGYRYIRENKIGPYLITVLAATLFHSTALIGIVLYVMHVMINGKSRMLLRAVVIAGSAFVSICFWRILSVFSSLNLINERYSNYLNSDSSGGGMLIRLVFYSFIALTSHLLLFRRAPKNHEYTDMKFYEICSIFLSLLSIREAQSVRIAHYFDMAIILGIPMVVKNSQYSFKLYHRKMNKAFIITFLLAYWIVVFGIRQSDQTVPFLYMTN